MRSIFSYTQLLTIFRTGSEKVTINEKPMIRQNNQPHVWIIPEEFLKGMASSVGEPLRIEVKLKDYSLSKIIRIIKFGLPASCDEAPFRNNIGEFCSSDESLVVRGVNSVKLSPAESFPEILPYHLSNRIVFVGRRPGQISEWPREGFAEDWDPVWALAFKKRNQWEAFFCGTAEDAKIDSIIGQPLHDKKKVKLWRNALWINRKVTAGPKIGQLKKIWNKYVEAASHV